MLELIVPLLFCYNVLNIITEVYIYYVSCYKDDYIIMNVSSLLILKCIYYLKKQKRFIINIKTHCTSTWYIFQPKSFRHCSSQFLHHPLYYDLHYYSHSYLSWLNYIRWYTHSLYQIMYQTCQLYVFPLIAYLYLHK